MKLRSYFYFSKILFIHDVKSVIELKYITTKKVAIELL